MVTRCRHNLDFSYLREFTPQVKNDLSHFGDANMESNTNPLDQNSFFAGNKSSSDTPYKSVLLK